VSDSVRWSATKVTEVIRSRDCRVRAGAILLGKTNTPERTMVYETDSLVYGWANNPYDRSCTCGASGESSGGRRGKKIFEPSEIIWKNRAQNFRKPWSLQVENVFNILDPVGNYFELIEMKSA
jgi:hypothetical protein